MRRPNWCTDDAAAPRGAVLSPAEASAITTLLDGVPTPDIAAVEPRDRRFLYTRAFRARMRVGAEDFRRRGEALNETEAYEMQPLATPAGDRRFGAHAVALETVARADLSALPVRIFRHLHDAVKRWRMELNAASVPREQRRH